MTGALKTHKDEHGAVLLTTLLVMSIMAALTVAIMDDIRFSVKRAANIQAYAQADWLRTAAEDFSRVYVEQFAGGLDGPAQNTALLAPEPILFPIDGGMLAFQVRDGSQCLALSSANSSEGGDHWRRLLENLGWSPIDTANFIVVLQDWQDEDAQISTGGAEDYTYLAMDPAYRTAGQAMQSVSELRALSGMNEQRFQELRPYICGGGAVRETAVNVNTLSLGQAPLLGAILGADMMEAAAQCISARPEGGYEDESAFKACPALAGSTPDQLGTSLVYQPKYIWIEADVEFLEARRTSVFEFNIDSGKAKRTYRRHTAEARRPYPPEPEL